MSANPIAGLLQVISGGSRKESDPSGENGFAGLIQAFVRDESSQAAKRDFSLAEAPAAMDRTPEARPPEDIAVGRVAALVHAGVLNRKEVESLDQEEYQELENWVLAGADGLFPPLELPLGLQDLSGELNQEQLASLLDWLAGGEAGSLAEKVETITALMQGEENGSTMLHSFWQNLGLESIDKETLQTMQATLAESLGTDGAAALAGMSREELSELLARALSGGGIENASETLEQLPESVLRSMGLQILEVSEETGATGTGLLDQLASDLSLRDRIAQLQEGAEGHGSQAGPAAAGEDAVAALAGASGDPAEGQGGTGNSLTENGLEAAEEQTMAELTALSAEEEAASTLEGTERPVDPVSPKAEQVNPAVQSPASVQNVLPAEAAPVEVTSQQMADNIERIEQVMRLSVRRNLQRVSLQLSPPQLGRITMRIQVRNGAMSAVIQTENVDARNLLSQGIEQLRQNLQVQGIDLEQFDVNLSDREMEEGRDGRWTSGQRSSSRDGGTRGGTGSGEGGEGNAFAAEEETAQTPGAPVWTSDSVNVIA